CRALDRRRDAGAGAGTRRWLQRTFAAAAGRAQHGRLRCSPIHQQVHAAHRGGGGAVSRDRCQPVRRADRGKPRRLERGVRRPQRAGRARRRQRYAAGAAHRLRPRRPLPRSEPRAAPRIAARRHRTPLCRSSRWPRLGLLVGHAGTHAALLRPGIARKGGRRMKPARPLLAWLAASLFALLSVAAARAATPPPAQPGGQVFYQIFFRSFRDSNGDRIGDLKGLTSRLGYIKQLGATTILLTPLQPSPYYHNYFATAFKAIDPAYGTLDDYFAFIRAAHATGLKVYLDQEFQYVAEGHPWWRTSICKPQAKYADYLLWKDARHCVSEPFLDRAKWLGYTGKAYGIAMVNLNDPAVKRYFTELLLYWADPHGDGSGRAGVDGFRIDHMMDALDHKGLDKNLFADFWTPLFKA